MRGFSFALRAELYRLGHSRGTWLSLLMLTAISASYILLSNLSERAGLGSSALNGLEQGGDGWVHAVDAWRFTLSATCLLLLIHGARSISADRASGVLRLGLCRASSRSAVVSARACMALPMVLAAFLFSGAGALLTSALFYDFGPLVEDGYELMSAVELRSELVAASLATLLPLVAMHTYGVMLSALCTRSIDALAFSLVSLLCYDFFKDFLEQPVPWIFASFAPTFADTSTMHEMSGLATGYSDMGATAELLWSSHLIPIPYIILCLAAACFITARRQA